MENHRFGVIERALQRKREYHTFNNKAAARPRHHRVDPYGAPQRGRGETGRLRDSEESLILDGAGPVEQLNNEIEL
jgi:hypothetical protein